MSDSLSSTPRKQRRANSRTLRSANAGVPSVGASGPTGYEQLYATALCSPLNGCQPRRVNAYSEGIHWCFRLIDSVGPKCRLPCSPVRETGDGG